MSNVKIYHNPRCSKSRQALQIIKDHGIEPKVIEYLKKNKQTLIEGINKVEGLSLTGPEASYLAWIDCREAKLLSPSEFMIQQAKVGVHDGEWFGNKDYVRLNFGCPRSVLEDSIARIQKAFSQRN